MKKTIWFLALLSLLFTHHGGYAHETLDIADAGDGEIGIDEKTGQSIPLGLSFRDEEGAQFNLAGLQGKPAILTLVYYTCEHICPLMLGGLSQALPRLALVAGKDYRVLTVSFDETDTPEKAAEVRKNYIKAAGLAFPEGGWKFLTGDRESIGKLTRSVGFRFKKDLHGFNHPVALIFLSPEGKISKYLQVTKYQYGADYPITFSSYDLNLALTEAARGESVTGFKKALLYCFSHEPPGQSKFFNFIAVIGIITLLSMAAFFVYLQVTSRRYRKVKGYDDEN